MFPHSADPPPAPRRCADLTRACPSPAAHEPRDWSVSSNCQTIAQWHTAWHRPEALCPALLVYRQFQRALWPLADAILKKDRDRFDRWWAALIQSNMSIRDAQPGALTVTPACLLLFHFNPYFLRFSSSVLRLIPKIVAVWLIL